MRFRTWPVAALGLGALLVLIAVSVLESSRRAQDIYTRLDDLNQQYLRVESLLRRLRSDVNLSGIFVRDYLLDSARERAPEYRRQIEEFRTANRVTLNELRALTPGAVENDQRLDTLSTLLDEYWLSLDPLFDWTPTEKLNASASFLKRNVIPRREAVLAIAQEIEQLNAETMAAQRTEVRQRHAHFRSDLYALLWKTLLLGAVVAVTAVLRLRTVERRADQQRVIAEDAERQMRALSQQLVATQEEERKKLSRELHDHVGQVLTALRMELGALDRLRQPSDAALARGVAESRQLVDNMVRTVRDLALGLRPSMLDDFGLQPALEWHVRDFTRRYAIPVQLDVTGDLTPLPDQYRTCVYRVVQEALTNCVRHASARSIRVTVAGGDERLDVTVSDDGTGIPPERKGTGLGLRGIEERVRELGGTLEIRSVRNAGTSLNIRLPLVRLAPTDSTEDVHFAGTAG
jgi:signal transduction histidine kinase